jgi:hypothetical protein
VCRVLEGGRVKLELDLSPHDAAVFREIRQAGGFRADADVLKVALWKLGVFLGLDVPIECFAVPFNQDMRRLLDSEQRDRDDGGEDTWQRAARHAQAPETPAADSPSWPPSPAALALLSRQHIRVEAPSNPIGPLNLRGPKPPGSIGAWIMLRVTGDGRHVVDDGSGRLYGDDGVDEFTGTWRGPIDPPGASDALFGVAVAAGLQDDPGPIDDRLRRECVADLLRLADRIQRGEMDPIGTICERETRRPEATSRAPHQPKGREAYLVVVQPGQGRVSDAGAGQA